MPPFQALPLRQIRGPFDDPGWLFELKLDGFRALAHVREGKAELVSRNGRVFRSRHFAPLCAEIPAALRVGSAVLDGELVVLDSNGRPLFGDLLRRRGAPPVFVAFDVLELSGKDLRDVPLLDRKKALRSAVRRNARAVQVVKYVRGRGVKLYAAACALDLERIVAKPAHSLYVTERHRYNFSSMFQGSGGSTEIRTLVSDWKVERGIAQAKDVAMATTENRIALSGGLDLVTQRFDDVTVALIDAEGCIKVQQKIRGPFQKPVVEKPNVLMFVTGPALNLLKKGRALFPGGRCEPFYAGSVVSPGP